MADQHSSVSQVPERNTEAEEHEEDFAALLLALEGDRERSVEPDRQIEGTVVSIGEEWVFVDIGFKSEGHIARQELTDEEGRLQVNIGDRVTAYVVRRREGEILLSIKMTAAASEEAARGAYRSGVPVEGLVSAQRKGGYTVRVFGKDAFCPHSQMDLRKGGAAEDYIGRRFTFRITEFSEGGRNIVLSRRSILEEERLKQIAALKERLAPGDLVEGTVTRLADFGAFVDLGGIEGLIPMSELAWGRVNGASEVLSTGDRVTVKIMDLNWADNRISLSRKQTLEDPWTTAGERYYEGSTSTGTVTRLMNFGAFVELEPGIEGLVHVSNMNAGRRVNHPREVLNEGDKVEVRVLSADAQARRIGLELCVVGDGEAVPELNPGDVVSGTVDSVKEYGVFVFLPGGKSGLLHVSQIEGAARGDLRKRFQPGTQIDVEILEVDLETKKISLSTRSLTQRHEEAQFKGFVSDKKRTGTAFGTLGDLLKEKLNK
jgi:small subunit ribosomal protein S1